MILTFKYTLEFPIEIVEFPEKFNFKSYYQLGLASENGRASAYKSSDKLDSDGGIFRPR